MILLLLAGAAVAHAAPATLLNVSYDVTREFYRDYDDAFAKHWPSPVTIEQSHAGSSKQARAVLDGLQADVVTMNQATDIQLLADAGLVAEDWSTRLPDHAAPYTSTIVFLVRKGNPKAVKDWGDLAKPGTQIIVANPKTSGNGRYAFLAAWAAAKTAKGGDDAKAREFVATLFKNAPLLPTGGRDATTAFVQRGLGDVLLTFESEALQIAKVFSPGDYEVVTPSSSILAEAPVSVIDRVVDQRGTRELATEYLRYLWSDEGQRIAVKYFLRPRSPALLEANAAIFPSVTLHPVEEIFGDWDAAQKNFKDGGVFDAIYEPAKP